jgi:hypothetical protein
MPDLPEEKSNHWKCVTNDDGKHTFNHQNADDVVEKGKYAGYHVAIYLTCISCGERRALTKDGRLIIYDNGTWRSDLVAIGFGDDDEQL